MTRFSVMLAVAGALVLGGCNEQKAATTAPPPAVELNAAAVGHYCGMNVLEHSGPKGQILLASRKDPVWFSSARDAISFTMLPEEPKDISAIYVSDMAKAPTWDKPGTTNWIDARQATFVIGSRRKGGMGADEAVPFSERAAAERFAAENGGRLVTFAQMPRQYILESSAEESGTGQDTAHPGHHGQPAPGGAPPAHRH